MNKAPGLNGVSGKMAKEAFKALPITFVTLFNSCLSIGYFPNSWKNALSN